MGSRAADVVLKEVTTTIDFLLRDVIARREERRNQSSWMMMMIALAVVSVCVYLCVFVDFREPFNRLSRASGYPYM